MGVNRRAEECAAFFRKNLGYHRALEQMRSKWKSYGRCAGVVHLKGVEQKEREALQLFFGKPFYEKDIRFTLASWEAVLKDTSFSDVGTKALLEAYFHEPMDGARESREKAKSELNGFWAQLEGDVQGERKDWGHIWIRRMRQEKSWGYQQLLGIYKKNQQEALKSAGIVVNALDVAEKAKISGAIAAQDMPGRNVLLRLAVCSARATGWPHALDYQQVEGKLFIQALCCIFNLSAESAEERMEVYYQAGLATDTLSSFTIGRGLVLLESDKREHPGFGFLRERREICHLSLETLSGLTGADSPDKQVFVVENQMVFSQLCELCPQTDSVILCTSGQCRTASLILLDMLRDSGCEIWYSGDYDPEGMLIADKLVKRGKGQIRLWHYTVEEYVRCMSGQEIKEESLKMLGRLSEESLLKIGKVMMAERQAAYQERLLEELLYDIKEAVK